MAVDQVALHPFILPAKYAMIQGSPVQKLDWCLRKPAPIEIFGTIQRMAMRPHTRSTRSLLFYLILNMLVSAAATLAVLFAWDYFSGRDVLQTIAGQVLVPPDAAPGGADGPAGTALAANVAPGENPQPQPAPRADLPPPDVEVIQITLAAGVGDIKYEALTLQRVGQGDLYMAGWKLYDEGGNTYIFPDSPELVLFAGGAVRFFSKGGTDTATEIFWNRSEPAYESTELITLEDPLGNVRATYRIP
jgi:hypothetical protein